MRERVDVVTRAASPVRRTVRSRSATRPRTPGRAAGWKKSALELALRWSVANRRLAPQRHPAAGRRRRGVSRPTMCDASFGSTGESSSAATAGPQRPHVPAGRGIRVARVRRAEAIAERARRCTRSPGRTCGTSRLSTQTITTCSCSRSLWRAGWTAGARGTVVGVAVQEHRRARRAGWGGGPPARSEERLQREHLAPAAVAHRFAPLPPRRHQREDQRAGDQREPAAVRRS